MRGVVSEPPSVPRGSLVAAGALESPVVVCVSLDVVVVIVSVSLLVESLELGRVVESVSGAAVSDGAAVLSLGLVSLAELRRPAGSVLSPSLLGSVAGSVSI
jgi:hypothetical protein